MMSSVSDIQRKLETRTKARSETYEQHLFAMVKIAKNKILIDALIEYIVNGVRETTENKMTLYHATSIKDLKERLRKHAKIMEGGTLSTTSSKQQKGKDSHKNQLQRNKSARNDKNNKAQKCFNCGSEGHRKDSCPDKDKGPRCFNCGMYNHISKECRRPKKTV